MDKPVKVKKEITAEKKAENSAKRKETLRKKKLERKEIEERENEDIQLGEDDVQLKQEDINRIADEVDEIKRLLDEKEKKRNNFINKTPEEKLLYLYDKLIILDIITNNQMILDRMMGEIIRRHGYEFVKDNEEDNDNSDS
jgi:molecular chaperone GrpE (heat shock protein)